MRQYMLSLAALVSTGCAGLLGLDDFTDEEPSSSGGGSGVAQGGGTSTSQGGTTSTSTTTTDTGTAGGSGDGGSGAGTGDGGGGGGQDPLGVTPEGTVKVGILHARQFEANVEVVWSVEEADGGRVDESGLYVAPETPGTYHLVATSVDDPEVSVTVNITAAPLGVRLVGGKPGGPGTLDGPPSRSRVDGVGGISLADGGRKIVFTDPRANTVRVMDLNQDDEVETIAGVPYLAGAENGTGSDARFDRPTGIASARDSSVVFVVDSQNYCIRRINVTNNAVTTFAGECGARGYVDGATGATSLFDVISSIAMGPEGERLYVCDTGNGQVRAIDVATGRTRTMTQTALASIAYDCKVTAPLQQYVYVDPGNISGRSLLRFYDDPDVQSTQVDSLVSLSLDFNAWSADGWSDNDILASRNRSMYRLDLDTPGDGFELYFGSDDVEKYFDGPLDQVRMLGSSAMIANGGYSEFYFADDAYTIRRIERFDDEVVTVVGKPINIEVVDGPKADARLVNPFALELDEAGNVYTASFGDGGYDNTIRRTDAVTGAISTFSGVRGPFDDIVDGPAGEATFGFVIDMVRVGDALYVLDLFSSTIRRVSLEDGSVTTIAGQTGIQGYEDGVGGAALFDFSEGGGLETDGTDLYVADSTNSAIRKVALVTNEVTTLAGGTSGTADGLGLEAQFVRPVGLAFDAGILYIVDYQDHVLRQLDLESAEVTTILGLSGTPGNVDGGPAVATLQAPFRIAADHLGNLFVTALPFDEADGGALLIRRVALEDVEISTFAGAADSRGFAASPLPASLGCPAGVRIDAAGDLVFADLCDGAVGAIRPL